MNVFILAIDIKTQMKIIPVTSDIIMLPALFPPNFIKSEVEAETEVKIAAAIIVWETFHLKNISVIIKMKAKGNKCIKP